MRFNGETTIVAADRMFGGRASAMTAELTCRMNELLGKGPG